MSIVIGDVWSEHGFLNNKYPSPFNSRGKRWKNVSEFVESNGGGRDILLEGVTQKFRSNTHLLSLLDHTGNTPIVGDPLLSSVLTEVRGLLSSRRDQGISAFKRMMLSLSRIIRDDGYTPMQDGREIILSDLEEGDHVVDLVGEKSGTLDIYLSQTINDARIRSILAPYKKGGMTNTYILVGYLSRGAVSRSLTQLGFFHQIKYYAPSELIVDFVSHILSPRVEIASNDDPIYQLPIGSLPEIGADDPLVKQLNIPRPRNGKRTILKVYDFSPHYRVVV